MLSFLVRRVLQTVPIVLAVALLIFVLFSVIPGTFASSLSDDGRSVMDPAVVERMNKELGLNDPVALRSAATSSSSRSSTSGPRSGPGSPSPRFSRSAWGRP